MAKLDITQYIEGSISKIVTELIHNMQHITKSFNKRRNRKTILYIKLNVLYGIESCAVKCSLS